MNNKPFYNLLFRIEDKSKLACLFNKVLDKLDMARIISAPKIFERDETYELDAELFYDTCLWEMYLHGVISKLNYWRSILDEYESDFQLSWKYYASSKRLESIKKYGGNDEDYDTEGNIKSLGLANKDLVCYTVIADLIQDDCIDIVQDTKPEHLDGLCSALQVHAKMSIADMFKEFFGKEIPTYKQNKNGEMEEMTFADKVLLKASNESQADSLSAVVLLTCQSIQAIIDKIRKLDKFQDNKGEISSISKDLECLLRGDFNNMEIIKTWKI